MIVKIIKGLGFLLLLAFASIVVAFFLDYLSYNGVFQRWYRVGTLNGERIIKIIDIGIVETESGDLYQQDVYYFYRIYDDNALWTKINDISGITIWEKLRLDQCRSFSFLPFGQSFFEDSKKACIYFQGNTATLVYAINKQGDLYIWSNIHGWEGNGFYKLIILPGFAGILGIVVGIIIMIRNSTIKQLHRRNQDV